MNFILASESLRRQELFKIITEDFKIKSPNIAETVPEGLSPENTAEYLAVKKALAAGKNETGCVIIGCDTIVVTNGEEILGKPKDAEQARYMLKLLSGTVHTVMTGCCIYVNRGKGKEKTVSFVVKTHVEFYNLTDEQIEEYIKTGECFDKAGAYGIQYKGALLVKGIIGDYFNVVGLPVAKLKREIESNCL